MLQLSIDPEFKSIIPPLNSDEFSGLEKSIMSEGCRDALIIWEGILIDGHNRYEICQKHGIEFKTIEMAFETRQDALNWIINNQLGRRNLTPGMISYLRGKRYNSEKKSVGEHKGNQYSEKSELDQNDPIPTAKKIADELKVSEPTIKRDAKYAKAVDTVTSISDSPAEVKKAILSCDSNITKKDTVQIAAIAKKEPEKAKKIIESVISGKAKDLKDAIRGHKRAEVIANLESVKVKEVKAVQGVYDVIVIDPPWDMQKIDRDVAPNQTGFDYPTMSTDEIKAVKIPAADSCHLWLWTTHKFLPDSLEILKTWGFKYVCTFVWHKNGGFQPFGLPQYNCEFVLYARKGSPVFIDTKALNTCFNADRTKHSEKPEIFYDIVRRVTAGRRIDMFNRRAIDGFFTWGKEAE